MRQARHLPPSDESLDTLSFPGGADNAAEPSHGLVRSGVDMVFTLTWLGTAVLAPAAMAKRALRLGQAALRRRNYADARRHLERAAAYEPLREEAVCLMAEASLYANKPADALYALNTLLLEQQPGGGGNSSARSPRVRLLRGIAGCMVGRPAAARRELAGIPKDAATVDDLLAAAQACVMSGDETGASQLLDALESHPIDGPLAARLKLCRAALHYRCGNYAKALDALPPDDDCSPPDAVTAKRIRTDLLQKI
ncbi:MAG TPA: hypothetical protein VHQ47_00500, partial [Phycisphaerae bacterium]|nr:hypothetical protein [Phycisphaerae bacterium]